MVQKMIEFMHELDDEEVAKVAIVEMYLAERRKQMLKNLRRVGVNIKDYQLEDIICS